MRVDIVVETVFKITGQRSRS